MQNDIDSKLNRKLEQTSLIWDRFVSFVGASIMRAGQAKLAEHKHNANDGCTCP